MSDTPDIELRGLVKRFGELVAVAGIDLEVRPGEFLALLGPSGCGKTTTLRVIAGFEEPTEGEVLIGGRSVLGDPPHKREVNTLFQHYALFPHLSVADNVAYGLKQRKVSRGERLRTAAEALELVHMAGFEQRRPAELSGGQQQRVALARAIVMEPRVLLLDEPLSALDRKLRKEMQIELKRIQEDIGMTFVIVTHDQEEAMALADRVAVMNRGSIEQLDQPHTIYDRPDSAFVAGFIGEMNYLEGTLRNNGRLTADCGDGVVVPIGRALSEAEPGARVKVGVRPEQLTARRDGEGEPATVVAAMLVGHEVRLLSRLRNGAELLAVQPRDTDAEVVGLRHGDPVVLTWTPEVPLLLETADGNPDDADDNPEGETDGDGRRPRQ